MSAEGIEILLARIYTDEAFRARFLADPEAIALREGCDAQEAAGLAMSDLEGLALAAASFLRKREGQGPRRPGWWPWG